MNCPNCGKHIPGSRDNELVNRIYNLNGLDDIECTKCKAWILIQALNAITYKPISYTIGGTTLFVKRREEDKDYEPHTN